ncbi:MAG: rRNA maturation RNase YbeY [Opitutaceae bacterium]|jgi:probable rRNA maturation factor
MPRSVEITVRHPGLSANRKALRAAIATLDGSSARFSGGCPDGELSVAILTDAELALIHGDFLDDPSMTDVITFEGQAALGTAGEICISADAAARYAATHKRSFSEELTLYLVHGWLHLAGYDDLRPELKRAMRRAEKRAMSLLAERRLLNGFRLKAIS